MPLLEVGRIGRAHGTGGEVRVTLTSERTDRLDPGSILDADGDTLEVVTSRRHGDNWLVRFVDVDDRSTAEGLRGLILSAEVADDGDDEVDPDDLWVHQVVGLAVVDPGGTPHGTVVAVQANPAHDLLVLDDDTLVPVVFITAVGDTVVVDAPEGLWP